MKNYFLGEMAMIYEKLRQSTLPQLIPPQAKILVAVSGGPDSMALSHVLWRYAQENRAQEISLVLTHVHHGVRRESDEEALMVQEIAKRWGVPCLVHRFDAKAYAKASGQSFETAAREWRYARWKEDMVQYNCNRLATAHHLGDQAETVLYRLLRGSGTAGLAGIYPQRGEVIRPFLTVSKDEILEYCQREQIPYALDSTNFQTLYVRNRIRLELLPELKKSYNPRILETIARTAEVLRWDEEYLDHQAGEAWKSYGLSCEKDRVQLSRAAFQEPKAILSRLIRRAAVEVTGEPRGLGFNYVREILDSGGKMGWKQDLPHFTVHIRQDGIWFLSKADSVITSKDHIRWGEEILSVFSKSTVRLGEWSELGGPEVEAGLFLVDEFDPNIMKKEEILAWADFDHKSLSKLDKELVFRFRREGDKFWIKGLGHKSLKKVFQEARISAEERKEIPLFAVGSQILWIPGVKQSDSCAAGMGSRVRVLIRRNTRV